MDNHVPAIFDIGHISVIGSSTNNVIKTIEVVGAYPYAIEYNPSNNDIYAANHELNTVSVIDRSTNKIADTVNVGNGPYTHEYNPSNNDICAANHDSNTVSVIDRSTNKIADTVNVGNGPYTLEYNPSNNDIYVLDLYSNSVDVISTANEHIQEPPTSTTITSATDGSGNQVQNEISTVSTSLTFQVTATPGRNPAAGFECGLDGKPFSRCATSNPATIRYNTLATGQQHTFKVRGIDDQGNTDPNLATFTWTMLLLCK